MPHSVAAEPWLSTAPGPHANSAARPGHRGGWVVPDCVHTGIDTDQTADPQPVVDSLWTQSEPAQLATGDVALLASSQRRDRPVKLLSHTHRSDQRITAGQERSQGRARGGAE
jgi:hypothetical protein